MKSSTDFKRGMKKRESDADSGSSLRILSYRLLNNHVQFLYPRLGGVEKSLKQAMIPIPFEVYVCSIVFFSIIAGVIGLGIGIVVSLVVERNSTSCVCVSLTNYCRSRHGTNDFFHFTNDAKNQYKK